MKTIKQINAARTKIAKVLQTPELSDAQRTLFAGMLNALVWVADGPNASTVDRLLAGEPVAAGKDTKEAIDRLRFLGGL